MPLPGEGTGKLYVVGTGPGPLDQMTGKAQAAIRASEYVVGNRTYLQAIRPLFAGKQVRESSIGKEVERAKEAVELAASHNVALVSGGDPGVYGMAGIVLEVLERSGLTIPVEVVPGVTAASGASASAGIPLTHRDCAHACVFITGHLQDGEPDLEWEALAMPRQTIVVYMGVRALPRICEQLIAHGLAADFPAAIVQGATRDRQRVLVGTLTTLPQLAAQEKVKPPALVIIGEVVRLRETLAWYSPGLLDIASPAAPAKS